MARQFALQQPLCLERFIRYDSIPDLRARQVVEDSGGKHAGRMYGIQEFAAADAVPCLIQIEAGMVDLQQEDTMWTHHPGHFRDCLRVIGIGQGEPRNNCGKAAGGKRQVLGSTADKAHAFPQPDPTIQLIAQSPHVRGDIGTHSPGTGFDERQHLLPGAASDIEDLGCGAGCVIQ